MSPDMQGIANAFAAGLRPIVSWAIVAVLIGSFVGFIFLFLTKSLEKFLRNLRKRYKD
jgi:ABC-type amino acid transport system permease subunit